MLSGVDLFDALETIARLQGRWDVAFTTTQRPDIVEAEFLAGGNGEACRAGAQASDAASRSTRLAPRHRPVAAGDHRERVDGRVGGGDRPQHAGAHAVVDHVRAEQQRPEFAGDVPTPDEIAKLEREIPKMGLEEMLEYAKKLIPDEVASNLFNMPSKYEMVLSNTYDLWFAPWAEKSKTTGLGATPAEAFQIGTGVELLDLLRLGHRIIKRSTDDHQVRFTRDELIADGVSDAAIDYLVQPHGADARGYQGGARSGPGSRRHRAPAVHLHAIPVHRRRREHDRHDPPPVGDGASMRRDVVPRSVVQPRNQSSGLGDRFKNAMNDAFEVFVGGILHRTAAEGQGNSEDRRRVRHAGRMEGAEEQDAFRVRLDAAGRRSLRRHRRHKPRSES